MLLVPILIFFTLQSPQDDRPTLPELARRFAPGPVAQSRTRELVVESIDSLLPKTDLVVLGRVATVTTRLSADQRDLHTDAVIQPIEVMFQRAQPVAPRPGTMPVVVRRWGGEMVIDGVHVIQEDADLRQFRTGEQVLLLLSRGTDAGTYRIVSVSSASFEVSGNRVIPLARAIRDSPVFDAVRELKGFVAAIHHATSRDVR